MNHLKKALSLLLALSMVLSYVPMPALAQEVCTHHTHDAACGYVEAVEAKPCTHMCSESCVTKDVTNCVHNHAAAGCLHTPAVEGVACDHVHDDACGYVPAQGEVAEHCGHVHGSCSYKAAMAESWSCGHVCTADSGCVTAVCAHQHNADCGYAAGVSGEACTFVCTECAAQEEPAPTVQEVDFMEYLEEPLAVLFQSEEDIDLHDWLVNAYGVPAEIPFTCQPATASYDAFEDGDTFPLTVTAGEGYTGSATVEAEVRYLNPKVTTRVLTTTFKIYQGDTVVASTSIAPRNDFNDLGYDYAPSWNVTLNAGTQYRLEVSWGLPLYEGYSYNKAKVAEMYVAGDFIDPASNIFQKLSLTGANYSSTPSENGSGSCYIQSSSYGTYTIHVALDRGDDDGQTNKFRINLTFQSSGKEADATSSVPQGSNISLTAAASHGEHLYTFSWTKGGVPIEGAAGKTYTVSQANPGDVYVATISRKPTDYGCTGSESWTHTFTVSNENISGPTPIEGLVYNGSPQILCHDGVAPTGFAVFYHMPTDFPGLYIGQTYENYWLNNQDNYFHTYYPGNAGTYTITYFIANSGIWGVTSNGSEFQCLQEGTITVTIAPASPELNTAPTAVTGLIFDGQTHALANPGSATNGTVQYRLNGGEWSNSVPTASNVGTYTVEYRVAGKNKNYKNLENADYTFTVSIAAGDVSAFDVTLDQTAFTYDGTPKEPTIAVTYNGTGLSSEQYTAVFHNNTDAGTATVVITSPNWVGEITRTFAIAKAPLTNLRIENADKVYNGSPLAENAALAFDGAAEADQVSITAAIAYADANADMDKPVTASNPVITGSKAGNYYLPAEITAVTGTGTISPRPVTVTADALSKTYGQTDPTLTFTADDAVPGEILTGITLNRGEGENAGEYGITVTVDPSANPNYSITPVNGTFTIEAKSLTSADITVSGVEESYPYTGSPIRPTVTVKDGPALQLAEGIDYTVSYGENTGAAKDGTVTLLGTGNYKDSREIGFDITPIDPVFTAPAGLTADYGQSLSHITLTTATGEAGAWVWTKPDTKVQVENSGYEAQFIPNDTDNYNSVPVTLPVAVTPATLIPSTAYIPDKTYDGKTDAPLEAVFFRGLVNGDQLVQGVDYTAVARFEDPNAGSSKKVTVTVTLRCPNYILARDTVESIGTINTKPVDSILSLDKDTFVYNGQAHQPAVTVKHTDGTVIPASEYIVSYSGNVNAGTGTVTVQNLDEGNYSVTQNTIDFTITPATLTITAENKSGYIGTGLPKLTWKVSGLIGTDTLLTEPTLTTGANMNKLGTYAINVAGADAGSNYTILYVPGDLTVIGWPQEVLPAEPAAPAGTVSQAAPRPITVPISGEENTIHVNAQVKDHEATILDFDVDRLDRVVGDHVETIGTVTMDFSGLKQNIERVNIPTDAIAHIAEAAADEGNDTEKLEILLTKDISVEFDAIALAHKIEQAEAETITITVLPENRAGTVTREQKEAFANRPAYQVTIHSGDKHISELDGEFTVSVAYELKKGETAEGLQVCAVAENGELIPCETEYDAETGRIRWKTHKYSFYVITFKEPTK